MPRITAHIPVTIDLSDEVLETASTVNDVVGFVRRIAKSPEARDLAGRIVRIAQRERDARRRRQVR